jgi:hypothetical protein
MIPVADALSWLLKAGYSAIRYPTDRHPLWLRIPGLGAIAVTDNKVPVRYLPLPPNPTSAQILGLFKIIPVTA